jgi:hypothetical protein
VAIAQAISNYLHSVGTNIGSAWPFPVIVHGAARGTDQLADAAGLDPEPHFADRHHYDQATGYRHNAAMVALGADVCLAFILDDSAGAATPPPSPKPPASPPAATSTGADDPMSSSMRPGRAHVVSAVVSGVPSTGSGHLRVICVL